MRSLHNLRDEDVSGVPLVSRNRSDAGLEHFSGFTEKSLSFVEGTMKLGMLGK